MLLKSNTFCQITLLASLLAIRYFAGTLTVSGIVKVGLCRQYALILYILAEYS